MLSRTHTNWLNRAIELAKTSQQKQKHAAIIVKSGSHISQAVNVHKNDPYFVSQINPWNHAESHSIRKYGKKNMDNLKGATIYVARVNSKGVPLMSKPCESCQEILKECGIKKIYYTISNEMDL